MLSSALLYCVQPLSTRNKHAVLPGGWNIRCASQSLEELGSMFLICVRIGQVFNLKHQVRFFEEREAASRSGAGAVPGGGGDYRKRARPGPPPRFGGKRVEPHQGFGGGPQGFYHHQGEPPGPPGGMGRSGGAGMGLGGGGGRGDRQRMGSPRDKGGFGGGGGKRPR